MSGDIVQGSHVAKADDLTRIEGIGPKLARRLNDVGIRTYADLASRSASEIAKLLPDIPRAQSGRAETWRDQARRLAAEAASQEGAEPGPADSQRYESFVVRVLLKDDGSIRDTRMEHIGTGEVRRWAGWEPGAMRDFATTARRPSEPTQADAGEPEAPTSIPQGDFAPAAATSRRENEVQPVAEGDLAAAPLGAHEPLLAGRARSELFVDRSVVRAAERFAVTMTLDLTEAAVTAERLAYSAVIEARPLSGTFRRPLARVGGVLATAEAPAIRVETEGLPPGAYRLVGAVSLRVPGASSAGGLAAAAEGMMLQVLPA